MKEVTITKYQCEICGTTFDSKEDAGKCECSHVGTGNVEFLYHPNCKYPYAVRVETDDWRVIEYREGSYAGFAPMEGER